MNDLLIENLCSNLESSKQGDSDCGVERWIERRRHLVIVEKDPKCIFLRVFRCDV